MNSEGTGAAGDATVSTRQDAEARVRYELDLAEADAAIAAAETKVERQEAHLAAAKDALAAARKARKELD